MNQRPAKTHAAGLRDGDTISIGSLVKFCREAKNELEKAGEEDSALRFEIFEEWLRNDYKGGPLKFTSKALGL
jgi:hypothetical protein